MLPILFGPQPAVRMYCDCRAHIVLRRKKRAGISCSLPTSFFSSELGCFFFFFFLFLLLVRDRRCAAVQYMPDQEEE